MCRRVPQHDLPGLFVKLRSVAVARERKHTRLCTLLNLTHSSIEFDQSYILNLTRRLYIYSMSVKSLPVQRVVGNVCCRQRVLSE